MSSASAPPPPAGEDPCEQARNGVEKSQASGAEAQPEPEPEPEPQSEPALPPLSPHEFKQYNRLAEHMDYFVRPQNPPTLYL